MEQATRSTECVPGQLLRAPVVVSRGCGSSPFTWPTPAPVVALLCAALFGACRGAGDRPAEADAFGYERGVVVNHWLGSVSHDTTTKYFYAAPWFDEEDVAWIATHGFDHIQIAVDAEEWFDAAGAIIDRKLHPFDAIVRAANSRGLGVVLVYSANYSLPFAGDDPFDPRAVARRTAEWRAIASRFAQVGDGLRFDADERLWPVSSLPASRYHRYVNAVRESSPTRFFYLSAPVSDEEVGDPYVGSNAAFLDSLGLTGFDANVGVSLVYWEPRVFVWQNPAQPRPVRFPGTVPDFRNDRLPFGAMGAAGGGFADIYAKFARAASGSTIDEQTIASAFARIASWRDTMAPRRAFYIRRFGINLAHAATDSLSVTRYLSAVTRLAAQHRLGWAVYDYDTGKAVRGSDGRPTALYFGLGIGSIRPRR